MCLRCCGRLRRTQYLGLLLQPQIASDLEGADKDSRWSEASWLKLPPTLSILSTTLSYLFRVTTIADRVMVVLTV
jgi:hypothetical protein